MSTQASAPSTSVGSPTTNSLSPSSGVTPATPVSVHVAVSQDTRYYEGSRHIHGVGLYVDIPVKVPAKDPANYPNLPGARLLVDADFAVLDHGFYGKFTCELGPASLRFKSRYLRIQDPSAFVLAFLKQNPHVRPYATAQKELLNPNEPNVMYLQYDDLREARRAFVDLVRLSRVPAFRGPLPRADISYIAPSMWRYLAGIWWGDATENEGEWQIALKFSVRCAAPPPNVASSMLCDMLGRASLREDVLHLRCVRTDEHTYEFRVEFLSLKKPLRLQQVFTEFNNSDQQFARFSMTCFSAHNTSVRGRPMQMQKPNRRNDVDDSRNKVSIDSIEKGLDTRTTVMLRNIPNHLAQKDVMNFVDHACHCKGLYDFFYLRIDFHNDHNVGYAFINFSNLEGLIKFVRIAHDHLWLEYCSSKVARVSYATQQGREALISRFRNSSVRDQPVHHRPVLFYNFHDQPWQTGLSVGDTMPLPEPDNTQKLRRSKENTRAEGLYHNRNMSQRTPRSNFDRGNPNALLDKRSELERANLARSHGDIGRAFWERGAEKSEGPEVVDSELATQQNTEPEERKREYFLHEQSELAVTRQLAAMYVGYPKP